jgi:hypothetical protein
MHTCNWIGNLHRNCHKFTVRLDCGISDRKQIIMRIFIHVHLSIDCTLFFSLNFSLFRLIWVYFSTQLTNPLVLRRLGKSMPWFWSGGNVRPQRASLKDNRKTAEKPLPEAIEQISDVSDIVTMTKFLIIIRQQAWCDQQSISSNEPNLDEKIPQDDIGRQGSKR